MSKIIIIGPAFPLRGGIAESNHALHQAFQKCGTNSSIVSYSLQYPQFLFPGTKQTTDLTNTPISNIVNLINTINPVSWIKAARYITAQNPDYVIARYWHPYFSICLSVILFFLRKKSIFVIGWIDNVIPHDSMPFQKYLTSIFVKSCNDFLVMSDLVRQHLKPYVINENQSIVLAPHPIYNVFGNVIPKEQALKRLGIINNNENSKYILFFGLVRKYKGLDMLLEVMNSKRIEQLGVKLIIAGEFYDSKEKYEQLINKLNTKKDRVLLYPNYIPNNKVVNFFCAADIVVQPYLSATQSGVSMIAYNFNKPMVLTNVGGLSEYVRHGVDGYLVDATKESIILALEDYYNNNREETFSNFVRQRKVNYGWDSLVSKFNSIYEKSNEI